MNNATCRAALAVVVAGLAWTPSAHAQANADVAQFLRARWAASCTYTLAIAEQMPADKYHFRPTPEQMTFAEQLLHIAEQDRLIFKEMGLQTGESPRASHTKAEVLRVLQEIEGMGSRVLEQVAARSTVTSVDSLNGMMLALDHTTHHRGQLIVYLRLNGVTPPEYRR
jgi:uncharacterized damage-inducible protein DinB